MGRAAEKPTTTTCQKTFKRYIWYLPEPVLHAYIISTRSSYYGRIFRTDRDRPIRICRIATIIEMHTQVYWTIGHLRRIAYRQIKRNKGIEVDAIFNLPEKYWQCEQPCVHKHKYSVKIDLYLKYFMVFVNLNRTFLKMLASSVLSDSIN